jgi:hypothetical protein
MISWIWPRSTSNKSTLKVSAWERKNQHSEKQYMEWESMLTNHILIKGNYPKYVRNSYNFVYQFCAATTESHSLGNL